MLPRDGTFWFWVARAAKSRTCKTTNTPKDIGRYFPKTDNRKIGYLVRSLRHIQHHRVFAPPVVTTVTTNHNERMSNIRQHNWTNKTPQAFSALSRNGIAYQISKWLTNHSSTVLDFTARPFPMSKNMLPVSTESPLLFTKTTHFFNFIWNYNRKTKSGQGEKPENPHLFLRPDSMITHD